MAIWLNGFMAEQKFLLLKDILAYKNSFLLSNKIWEKIILGII